MAEITRRGLELFLDRFPESGPQKSSWQIPKVNGGGIRVPLTKLKEVIAEDEELRGAR